MSRFLNINFLDTYVAIMQWPLGINPDPQILGVVGVVGCPWNIIINYNVQKYEMRTLSKMVTFQT